MTGLSQTPRDRILWILSESGERMNKSDLRRRMRLRLSELDPILEELENEELRGNLETRHWSKISKTLPILGSAGFSSSFVGFM